MTSHQRAFSPQMTSHQRAFSPQMTSGCRVSLLMTSTTTTRDVSLAPDGREIRCGCPVASNPPEEEKWPEKPKPKRPPMEKPPFRIRRRELGSQRDERKERVTVDTLQSMSRQIMRYIAYYPSLDVVQSESRLLNVYLRI